MADRQTYIAKNILAIVFGVIGGVLAFIASSFFLFITGVLSWTDGGPDLPQSNFLLSIIITTIAGSIVGGLITTLLSKKNDLIYSLITGIILLITWLVANTGFDFSYYDTSGILCLLLILPCSAWGGWIGRRLKTRNIDNN
jgi:hypothetical protein